MANADTNPKRISASRFMLPFAPSFPVPDGSVGIEDRPTIAWTYAIWASVAHASDGIDVLDFITPATDQCCFVTESADLYDFVTPATEVYDR